jgi:hypothetical protein
MVAVHPGAINTFVPNHAATQNLVVDFSRNAADFSLNRYVKLIPVTEMTGYYLEMTVEEAGRVLSADDAEHDWADGADAPDSNDGTESFQYKQFLTRRKAYTARLGNLSVAQASWEIVAQHARIKAAQAMTARTKQVVSLLTTSGNYLTGHTSAVASISGNSGTWALSTSSRQDIKRSLNHAAKTINKQTLGVVKKKDLVLVISPDCATEISECQEIVEMLKGSVHSKGYIDGGLWNNEDWGLPDKLYGVQLVVEDCVNTTTAKGVTTSKDYVMSGSSAALVARPGALEGMYGGPEFASCSLFVYSDLETFTKNDKDNERTLIRVVDNRIPVITSPISSYLFTSTI